MILAYAQTSFEMAGLLARRSLPVRAAPAEWSRRLARHQLSVSVRIDLYEALAADIEDEADPYQSIRRQIAILESDGRNSGSPLLLVLRDWERQLQTKHLHQVVDGWVPSLEVTLLRAGYEAENLPAALRDLVTLMERRSDLSGLWVEVLLNPTIAFAGAMGALVHLCVVIVPDSEAMLGDAPVDALGRSLIMLSHFFLGPAPYLTPLLVGAAGWLIWSLDNWAGLGRDWADRHIELYRTHADAAGTAFLLAYAALAGAKKNALEALLSLRADASPYERSRLDPALPFARTNGIGKSLLYTGKAWPDGATVQKLITMDGRQKEAHMIRRVAERRQVATKRRVVKLAAWMQTAAFGVVFALMVYMFLANYQLGMAIKANFEMQAY